MAPRIGGAAPPPPDPPKKHTERVLDGNWLQTYAIYTQESESPDVYHLWAALSALASAVRRNVYLDQNNYILYPNLFVILVGPPGRTRKSTTIRMARKILMEVEGINFSADSLTREDLIRTLGKISAHAKSAALTIHSTELSSLIEPSGIKMVQFLTDIFDGDVRWKYSTKHQGKDTINNPVLNILAATTPTWIADGLPHTVIGHGFVSRTIFVYAAQRRYLRPFPFAADPGLIRSLTMDLDHISRLEGGFGWAPGAKDTYKHIYSEIDKNRPSDHRVEGFHNRKDIHVLKVAMLLSIAEDDSLMLHSHDIEAAFNMLNQIEETMHSTFSALGKYEHAADYERLQSWLREERSIPVPEIFQRMYAVGDITEIAKIIDMAESTGFATRVIQAGRPNVLRIRDDLSPEEDP